jgi:hypothetical protein
VGLFNNFHVSMQCRKCGQTVPRTLQFKYGECHLYDYEPGDSVGWGVKGVIHGEPDQGRAWLPCYSDQCPNCGDESDFADFALIVNRSLLIGAVQAPGGYRFREEVDVVPLLFGEEPKWEAIPSILQSAITRSFAGFKFRIQTSPHSAARSGQSNGDLQDVDFAGCDIEDRDEDLVLRISFVTENGDPFTIYVEKECWVPSIPNTLADNDLGNLAGSMAFWIEEQIIHGTVEHLNGLALCSGERFGPVG